MADILNTPLNETFVQQPLTLPATRRRVLWAGARTWSPKGALALVDQGLISGANFIVGILLARHLAPDQYGAYALAFQVFLFLSVAYAAVILEPLSVFGSSVYRNSNREYVGVLLRIHCVIAAVIVLGLGACAWALSMVSPRGDLTSALIGVAVASPCMLLFSLARRGFYVKLSPRQAALGALGYFAVVLGGLLLAFYRSSLSPLVAFLLIASGAGVTAPLMLARLGFSLRPQLAILKFSEVVRRHWGYGRWALGSAVAVWFSSAIYFPILGSFHGLAETGALQALSNFSSPIAQAFVAMSMLSLPYAAGVHHENSSTGAHDLAAKLVLMYAGGTILYWLIMVTFRWQIVEYLYAGKYTGIVGLIPWLALGSVLRISATSQAIILRAMHAPSLVFTAYGAASVVDIIAGIPLTWAFGLWGSIVSTVLSSAVALVVTLLILHRHARSNGLLKH
jgi:O-antigen/teichoic acid export membrane protein